MFVADKDTHRIMPDSAAALEVAESQERFERGDPTITLHELRRLAKERLLLTQERLLKESLGLISSAEVLARAETSDLAPPVGAPVKK